MATEFTAPEWHDGFARHAHSQWSAASPAPGPAPGPAAFSFGGAEPYNDYPSRDEERGAQRSWTPFYAIGGLVSVAFLLTAYMISHRTEREPTPGVQVVEGTVLGPKATSAAPVARTPAPHGSDSTLTASLPALLPTHPPPPLPAAVPPSHVASVPPPAVAHAPPPAVVAAPPAVAQVPQSHHAPPPPSATTRTATAQPNAPSREMLAQERAERAAAAKAAAAKEAASARADFERNLASARGSLDKNSLAPARRSITTALAEQPGNGAALQMQSELAAREQERDSLLGYARLCARQGQWVCAWHNAGHALTVDASSSEAREILSRSIAAQGAHSARDVDAGPRESDLAPPREEIGSAPPGPPIDPN